MIFSSDPGWDERWSQLDEFAMSYETAVIPFSPGDYLTEFYDFYRIKGRKPTLLPAADSFYEALRQVSGDRVWKPIAEKTESLFGLPSRVMVFDDDARLREALGGRRGLSPFFFVFGLMFCEFEGFTLCFLSGTNN